MSAISPADLPLRLSTTAGSAGNSTAQANPNASFGKYMSTTAAPASLWDDVTGAENAAGQVEYRCIFVANLHGTNTLISPTAYLTGEVTDFAVCAIGVDPTAASLIGASSAQALTIANELTAPAGVTFSSPTTAAAGVALGDILPGRCRAVWLRRTAVNSTATPTGDPQTVSIRVTGSTAG